MDDLNARRWATMTVCDLEREKALLERSLPRSPNISRLDALIDQKREYARQIYERPSRVG